MTTPPKRLSYDRNMHPVMPGNEETGETSVIRVASESKKILDEIRVGDESYISVLRRILAVLSPSQFEKLKAGGP